MANHNTKEDQNEKLSPEELQNLEDEILEEAAGGTDHPISPNYGCIE